MFYTPWPPCFHWCNVSFSRQPFASTAWVCNSQQQWLLKKAGMVLSWKNPTLAAAGPRNCRFFLDLAGLILWSVTHFPCLEKIFSSPLCSLFIWILCMIFISMKSPSFFLCQWFIFSFVLWFRVLTWLAKRENNGGVGLKKTVMLFCSYIWLLDKSLNYCIEVAWNFTVFADRKTRRIYQQCTVDGPHSSNNPVN